MKTCDLNSGMGRLRRATSKLQVCWDETKTHWRDRNASEFEENFLQPLLPSLTLTLASIHRMAEMVQRAEHELDEDRLE